MRKYIFSFLCLVIFLTLMMFGCSDAKLTKTNNDNNTKSITGIYNLK